MDSFESGNIFHSSTSTEEFNLESLPMLDPYICSTRHSLFVHLGIVDRLHNWVYLSSAELLLSRDDSHECYLRITSLPSCCNDFQFS